MKTHMRKFSQFIFVGMGLILLIVLARVVTENHKVNVNGFIANKPHVAATMPESETYSILLEALSSIARRLAASPGEFSLSRGLIPYFG